MNLTKAGCYDVGDVNMGNVQPICSATVLVKRRKADVQSKCNMKLINNGDRIGLNFHGISLIYGIAFCNYFWLCGAYFATKRARLSKR
jgi:hypothetical protein